VGLKQQWIHADIASFNPPPPPSLPPSLTAAAGGGGGTMETGDQGIVE